MSPNDPPADDEYDPLEPAPMPIDQLRLLGEVNNQPSLTELARALKRRGVEKVPVSFAPTLGTGDGGLWVGGKATMKLWLHASTEAELELVVGTAAKVFVGDHAGVAAWDGLKASAAAKLTLDERFSIELQGTVAAEAWSANAVMTVRF